MKREIGGLSCWASNPLNSPHTGISKEPGADELAEQLRILANLVPAHADLLRRSSSMLIKQACKITLVRRAMR